MSELLSPAHCYIEEVYILQHTYSVGAPALNLFSSKENYMKLRQTCAYMMIVGGLLVFSGGTAQAEQSSGGNPGGAMGTGSGMGSGTTGGSGGSMKPDQKHGIDGRTDIPKTKGAPASGESRRSPDSNKSNPGQGTSGRDGLGSSSGSMGSSGGTGTGSSGGSSGY